MSYDAFMINSKTKLSYRFTDSHAATINQHCMTFFSMLSLHQTHELTFIVIDLVLFPYCSFNQNSQWELWQLLHCFQETNKIKCSLYQQNHMLFILFNLNTFWNHKTAKPHKSKFLKITVWGAVLLNWTFKGASFLCWIGIVSHTLTFKEDLVGWYLIILWLVIVLLQENLFEYDNNTQTLLSDGNQKPHFGR